MTYTCSIVDEFVYAFEDNKVVGKFDTEAFLTSVISPVEFKIFEKNPEKTKFNIRRLEFNNYNLKK